MTDRNLIERMIEVEKWIAIHDAVCAERYRQILLWAKSGVAVIVVSTLGLIAAMWQVILHIEKL